MKTTIQNRLAAVSLAALLVCALTAQAQFSGNNQTLTINGVTNDWAGGYYVGTNHFNDVLQIVNAGRLSNRDGYLGYNVGDVNNAALVAGAGSIWSNSNNLFVGVASTGNTLTITNGGMVYDLGGTIGNAVGANNNSVLVTGAGSVWSNNNAALYIGNAGSLNTLTIVNGGQVDNANGIVGNAAGANNNSVLVTGPGSVWACSYDLFVGFNGSFNTLTIANGGTVRNNYGNIGVTSSALHSAVTVTGPGSVWTNRNDLYLGDTAGVGGTLTVANGGKVYDATGLIGYVVGASNNAALVTGAGSVWSNSGNLVIGDFSLGNRLTISNGGTVAAASVTVGYSVSGINNNVAIHGGNLVASTPANGVLEVRQGAMAMDSGTIQAQTVLLSNGSTGTLSLTGGTLMVNTLTNSGGANVFLSGCTLQPLSSNVNWAAVLTCTGGVTINTADANAQARNVNFSGVLSGVTTLNVTGPGALLLSTNVTVGGLINVLPGATLGGTFSGTNLKLNGGAHWLEGLNAISGVAGVDWDLVSLSGAVTLSGLSASQPVTVDVVNRGGLNGNTNPAVAQHWTFLTAAGGISGFLPQGFAVTTTGLDGWSNGLWSVAQAGNSLQLVYSPPALVTVSVLANPSAGGSVSGGGLYLAGTPVQLGAVASNNWFFMAWNDGATNNPHTVSAPPTNATFRANFGTTVGLGAALEATNLNWTLGGVAAWFVETGTKHGTASAAQSGALGADQVSYLQATTTGPGSLTFWWKVSSAPANFLQFYVDTQLVNQISGNVDWTQYAVFLGTSNQVTLTWVYEKNTSAVAGSDAGWLDQVAWLPCPYAAHVPQIFFQDPPGMLTSWVLNSAGGMQFARVLANLGGWALKAAGDIDGDGVSDLLFETAAGDIGGWFMNADGSTRSVRTWPNVGGWEIKVCGDYEGIGSAQLFFQAANGDTAYWRLDTNGTVLSSVSLGNMGGWKLRGLGDLDGDHKAELFWQTAAGLVAIWFHNPDGSIHSVAAFNTGAWLLGGVTDIDADGISDLLWQDNAGNTAGWFMHSNGAARAVINWGNTGGWKLKAAGR